MTALRDNINHETRVIPVTAPLSSPTYPLFYDIGSETIKVVARADTTEWEVERGLGDSSAADHGKGAALILNTSPFGGGVGGSGVTVDNTVDAPFTATTIIAAGATESAPDEATIAAIGPQVVLGAAFLDIKTQGFHVITFTDIFDNTFDFNVLPGLPEGMGIDMVGADFTFTETGIWSYTFQLELPAGDDATLRGAFGTQFGGLGAGTLSGRGSYATVSETIWANADDGVRFRITTTSAGTEAEYRVTPFLSILRLR